MTLFDDDPVADPAEGPVPRIVLSHISPGPDDLVYDLWVDEASRAEAELFASEYPKENG